MFRKSWDIFQNLWSGSKENFLLIERWNGSYEITSASRNLKKKEFAITGRSAARDLDSVKRPVRKADKIIFSLDSRSATTAESIVRMKRNRPDDPINESETDQLAHRGFWDFLNRHRAMAAKKMKVNDSDLIMAYIQIRKFSILKGGEAEMTIKGTFISRELLSFIQRFKDWGDIFIFESAGVLADFEADSGNLAVQIGENTITVFKSADGEKAFEAMDSWGTGILSRNLAAKLGIDEAAARIILGAYFAGGVSARVGKWMEVETGNELGKLSDFLEEVKKKSKIARPKVNFSFQPPFPFPAIWLKKLGGSLVRVDEELERREFAVKKKKSVSAFDPLVRQNALALLCFEYDMPELRDLNRLLRRRVKWLIPNF